MTKILVATIKPFAPEAVGQIDRVITGAGFEFAILEKYPDESAFHKAVEDAEGLIVRSDLVDAELMKAGKKLKIVARAGAGYDNIDLEEATKRGIVVMNTPGQNSNAVAELALGMMVYMARNCFNGKPGTELKGKNLGIQAYGYAGRLVAGIAKGFGMEIYAYDPFIESKDMVSDGVTPVNNAEELYAKCHYISLHLPANEKTKESVDYSLMSCMPDGAVLVNTARKEIMCEKSLLKMFTERDDFRYVSDVAPDAAPEIEKKYPGRFFFTPKKMGAQTREANVNAGIAAASQIVNFMKNGDTTFQVNK